MKDGQADWGSERLSNQRLRQITAKHEAAHALMHVVSGIPFADVEICSVDDKDALVPVLDDEGNRCCGVVRDDLVRIVTERGYVLPQESVLVAMAGMAAERMHLKKPTFPMMSILKGSAEHDYDGALEVTERHLLHWAAGYRDPHKYLRGTFFRAVETLVCQEKELATLTEALLRKGKLTYDECLGRIRCANRTE